MRNKPSSSDKSYWSSLLFTKLVVSTGTVLHCCPRDFKKGHFDFASVAGIVRSNAELWMLFVWLIVGIRKEEDWRFRILAFSLMENRARYRLNEETGNGVPDLHVFMHSNHGLQDELNRNAYFLSLSEKKKVQVLKGDKPPYIQDDVLDAIASNTLKARSYYRYLSFFVHTGPVSISRMVQYGRGDGGDNNYDRAAMSLAMIVAGEVLAACTHVMMMLHPNEAMMLISNLGRSAIDTIDSFKTEGITFGWVDVV